MKKFIIGIDEVGRGALAGPVLVAAAVILEKISLAGLSLPPLKDSKKLTYFQREKWFKFIKKQPQILYVLARANPKTIDKINISKAANQAATRAFKKILARNKQLTPKNCLVVLDSGLNLLDLDSFYQQFSTISVVKADEKFKSVKIASIVAKVSRDNYMEKIHQQYPFYGFDKHKGYGTDKHLKAIKKYGPSKLHRLTFIRKYISIK
jgi:ribonuclease HII